MHSSISFLLLQVLYNILNLQINKIEEINKNKMAERKQADRIIFQEAKHHKQFLRSQIDPALIDKIQIDQNPSMNYMSAYKNLYHDELQKTVQMHEVKKQKQRQFTQEDRYLFTVGMKQEKAPLMDQTNMTASQLSKYGQRYVDYDQERTNKLQDHVKRNYDGGQAFYKAHDKHLQRQQSEAVVTNQTLSNQLQYKQFTKYKEQQKKCQQNQAFKELKYNQWVQDQERNKQQKMGQMAFRQDIVKQMEQEQERRQRKSTFEYQNVARHNPITNPIEYHIDNPYILKEIQSRNTFKSMSMHQNVRY